MSTERERERERERDGREGRKKDIVRVRYEGYIHISENISSKFLARQIKLLVSRRKVYSFSAMFREREKEERGTDGEKESPPFGDGEEGVADIGCHWSQLL